jgi:signal transduction histidine kinase
MEPYLLPAVVVIAVFLIEMQGRRAEASRQSHAEELKEARTELALLHVAHAQQMHKLFEAHREDVANLCQRIQAPEAAVIEHQQHNVPDLPSMPLTDEQIAEQQELASVIERMERIENEGLVQ